eukprot:16385530-Heterocapsa_arctica.AAC.1
MQYPHPAPCRAGDDESRERDGIFASLVDGLAEVLRLDLVQDGAVAQNQGSPRLSDVGTSRGRCALDRRRGDLGDLE